MLSGGALRVKGRIMTVQSEYNSAAWQQAMDLYTGKQTLESVGESLLAAGEGALHTRIDRMAAQWTRIAAAENEAALEALFTSFLEKAGSYDDAAKLVKQELGGFVITAHPTFSLSRDAWAEAGDMMASRLEGAEITESGKELSLKPDSSPSLEEEGEYAAVAVKNIRLAIRRMLRIFYRIAHKQYGEKAFELKPGFMTVASWVGFDLDGRTDISWSRSLVFRYDLALDGVASLQDFWSSVGVGSELSDNIEAGLRVFEASFAAGRERLQEVVDNNEGMEGLAELNRLVMSRRGDKEAAMSNIDDALAAILGSEMSAEKLAEMAAFRAEWASLGLGQSHIHFRLNAVQLHNAIKPLIEMDKAPDRSSSRRHYMGAVSRLMDDLEPVNVHYGTLDNEQTTARRLFMLAAQFEKHFDGRTPIRLLVAESDTPFTLLTALYYARLFNVQDHVEISPLFETAIGLQRGDRVIAELIENKHFLNYIKGQGRFCVQLGFSDKWSLYRPACCKLSD